MPICAPAIVYIMFSLTHIIIDSFNQLYQVAFIKLVISVIFTWLLDLLCKQELGVISWIIVFLPFMFMSIITAILIFAFGINPEFGIQNSTINRNNNNQIITESGKIIDTEPGFDPLNSDFDDDPSDPPQRYQLEPDNHKNNFNSTTEAFNSSLGF
mgnify:CR=1 FL=1|tara:strand:+ start:180 stop:647 length:468 start_codon:yes stop_codon:yes gene_type:complete